jgi:phosphoadenosine phosphosulfate reductase
LAALVAYKDAYLKTLPDLSIIEAFRLLAAAHPGKIIFSTSFGIEDQLITHYLAEAATHIELFTLDTGRLFTETYSVWSRTLEAYGMPIKTYYPQAAPLEELVTAKGPNSFYESVENRKQCCYLRKVEPLHRAIAGKEVWITGLRAEQSPDRHSLQPVEWDEQNGIIKFHPLFYYTWEQVKEEVRQYKVPYNSLHDKGFVSIGCAPCTRAIKPGEDFRAGRWWWEASNGKECGLHTHEAVPAKEDVLSEDLNAANAESITLNA